MSSDKVLVRRLRRRLVQDQATLAALKRDVQARAKEAEVLAIYLSTTSKQIERALTQGESRLKELDQWRDDPVVLVRTTPGGYGSPVYHDARNSCGYVSSRGSFKELLLGEAEAAGHGPCSACGWRARSQRDAA